MSSLEEMANRYEYDPVFKRGDFWYFYDETWAFDYGPYDTEEQARCALELYCERELTTS